jgi:DNA-directed RNA polymerase subunit RPC12/RpoP
MSHESFIAGGASTSNSSSSTSRNIYGSPPAKNGFKCTSCGSDMLDTHPDIILTSDPAQKNVHCESCGFRGYRIV